MAFVVGGQLLRAYDDEGYQRDFNQAFTGFPKNVGFNNGLSVLQPDFVEGLEMPDYRLFPVDELVSGAVPFKDDHFSVTLPPAVDAPSGSGHKRKTVSSRSSRSSKKPDYWQVGDLTGRHFHTHRGRTVTWRD